MNKLLKLTNLVGDTFYIGAGWVIRPHYIRSNSYNQGLQAEIVQGSQVVHDGTAEYVKEDVDTIAIRVEASLLGCKR